MQQDSSRYREVEGSAPPGRLTIRARHRLQVLEPAVGYLVTLRLKDDCVIAATTPERRAAVGLVIRQGRERGLLACAVVERQVHAIVVCSRAVAGLFAGRAGTSLSLALRLEVAFEPARIQPLRDSIALANAFERVFRQDGPRPLSPAEFLDGTSLPDLVGMRIGGAYSRALMREKLPGVSERALLERFGVDWAQPVELDMGFLLEATLAATGRSSLRGRARENLAARRAAAGVARSRLSAEELAKVFEIDVRTAFRLRAADHDWALARAIELQLRLLSIRGRSVG